MTRPRILTADFWARRIDALTDNAPRAVRTGAQAVIAAAGQDLAGFDVFGASWRTLAGAFLGGVVAWIVTTLAAPPRD